jgi:predicted RecB family nuclease
MNKEMKDNIKKVDELLRVYKNKEYEGFNEAIGKFLDKYNPNDCSSCFEVADI